MTTENLAARFESGLRPHLGAAVVERTDIFEDERFPNLAVTVDGVVVATWGATHMAVRRSEDGGGTWGPEILVGPGIQGGGTIVDETTGDLLVFVHPEHPPREGETAPRTVYRSTDGGRSWGVDEATFEPDNSGHVPSLHFHEHGITLRRGPHAGRLLRPARVYGREDGYNTVIYSDDGGHTWRSGAPLRVVGTGEGAVAELADGRIRYSSRKHFFAADEPLRHERLQALSADGGRTWTDVTYSKALPDGPRYRGEERRGACYNGHFGMAGGLVRLPVVDRDILLYSNADLEGHDRVRMTVWASFDGGAAWPVKRLLDEGPSAYSSLEAGRPGTPSEGWIYLQYEERNGGGKFARFNLSWVLAGEATGDGSVPNWTGA